MKVQWWKILVYVVVGIIGVSVYSHLHKVTAPVTLPPVHEPAPVPPSITVPVPFRCDKNQYERGECTPCTSCVKPKPPAKPPVKKKVLRRDTKACANVPAIAYKYPWSQVRAEALGRGATKAQMRRLAWCKGVPYDGSGK